MTNTPLLKAAFSSRFKAWLTGWMLQKEVVQACEEIEGLHNEIVVKRDALHTAQIEIDTLQLKLREASGLQAKRQEQIGKLWNFISIRHRLHVPVENGSITDILQRSEGQ